MRASLVLTTVVSTAGLVSPCAADVVYERLGTPLRYIRIHDREYPASPALGESSSFSERTDGPDLERDARAGDSITLAGTARFVTDFEIQLGGVWNLSTQSASADVTLILYALSGGLPGAEIWSGTVNGVTFAGGTTGARDAAVMFHPNVLVPDSLAFGIAFPSVSGEETGFGLNYFVGDPTVGSTAPGMLYQDSATLAWRNGAKGENLQARVTAVPASATFAFLFAACAWATRRDRRAMGTTAPA